MSAPPAISHDDFVAGYRAGTIRVQIDPKTAARYVSARLLLPLVALPVLGLGVALALIGWIFTGLLILAVGIIVPRLIKRSAPHFVLMQSLQDADIYAEVTRSGIMQISEDPSS